MVSGRSTEARTGVMEEGDFFGDFAPNEILTLLEPLCFNIISYTISGIAFSSLFLISFISGILTVEFKGPGRTSFHPITLVEEPVPWTCSILPLLSADFLRLLIDYLSWSCFIWTSSQICEAGDFMTEGRWEVRLETKLF
jgi:hypothetical protein